MNSNQGIFENRPNKTPTQPSSPFSVDESAAAPVAESPFGTVARQASPFNVANETTETGRPPRLPERRKIDSPFEVAEPSEGFGFEASSALTPPPNPFEAVPVSPFSTPAQPSHAPSPFSVEQPEIVASPATQAAIAAFTAWDDPTVRTKPAHPFTTPPAFASTAATVPQAFETPSAPAVSNPPALAETAAQPAATPATTAPTPEPVQPTEESYSDSHSIRQLELRAIFGVDREMNPDEILQRVRALPGMRNVARLKPQDMATIEALKNLIPSLGFGTGHLKIYSGAIPLEFIREDAVTLAVQTDGGFAPGVRETLMIVARELNRIG